MLAAGRLRDHLATCNTDEHLLAGTRNCGVRGHGPNSTIRSGSEPKAAGPLRSLLEHDERDAPPSRTVSRLRGRARRHGSRAGRGGDGYRRPSTVSRARSTAPLLLGSEVVVMVTEPRGIDRACLLDEDTRRGAVDVDLGPKRCGACRRRGRSDQHRRQTQECVRLHDDAVVDTGLLRSWSPTEVQPKHVTSAHADPPSSPPPLQPRHDPARPQRVQPPRRPGAAGPVPAVQRQPVHAGRPRCGWCRWPRVRPGGRRASSSRGTEIRSLMTQMYGDMRDTRHRTRVPGGRVHDQPCAAVAVAPRSRSRLRLGRRGLVSVRVGPPRVRCWRGGR
jgi:hypothetical protein